MSLLSLVTVVLSFIRTCCVSKALLARNGSKLFSSKAYALLRVFMLWWQVVISFTTCVLLTPELMKAWWARGQSLCVQWYFRHASLIAKYLVLSLPLSLTFLFPLSLSLSTLSLALRNSAVCVHMRVSVTYVGKTHVLMSDDKRAYVDYSMAIHLEPKEPLLWYERSCCIFRLGILDKALADITTASEVRPGLFATVKTTKYDHD